MLKAWRPGSRSVNHRSALSFLIISKQNNCVPHFRRDRFGAAASVRGTLASVTHILDLCCIPSIRLLRLVHVLTALTSALIASLLLSLSLTVVNSSPSPPLQHPPTLKTRSPVLHQSLHLPQHRPRLIARVAQCWPPDASHHPASTHTLLRFVH